MKRALEPIADLAPLLGKRKLIGASAGPDGALWAVASNGRKTLVLRADESGVERVCEADGAIHLAQPLGDTIVVANARCTLRGENARVVDRDGKTGASFTLGDGIAELQTTHDGQIWCSYFDEGVFGDHPLGQAGLCAFDGSGARTFSYDNIGGDIADCYALNVADDENVWLYFYTEFRLVHLRRRRLAESWRCPVRGARAFAVARGHLLMTGGYDAHQRFGLYALEKTRMSRLADLQFLDENGEALGEWSFARGSWMNFIAGTRWYRVDLQASL